MKNEYDLIYSEDALLARALYLISETEFNIFVEDKNKEFEYEEIFERLFPSEVKINCIFPTGGKIKLKEAYSLFGNSNQYGKCFFIADGDFDLALEKDMIIANNFIYLKRYNIESYLLHKDTVLHYMRPKLKKTISETEEILGYDNWLCTVTPFFEKLFALHCLVQKHYLEVENVARGIERFLNNKGYPNENMFDTYKQEISNYVFDIDTEIEQMLSSLKEVYGSELGSFVCGKCYISSLKLLLNSKIKKKIGYDELKATLISGFDISQLSYVKEKLFSYIAS